MGGGGYPSSGPAAHRASRSESGDDPADWTGVHFAARRHSQRARCTRAGATDTGRRHWPAKRCSARSPRDPAARSAAPGHRGRTRDRDRRRPGRSGGYCRSARCAGVSADSVRRRPLPLRTSGLHGRAHPRSGRRPRDAFALRPDVLHRLGRAAHVGVQRDRPDARRHGGGPARPSRLGDGKELPGRDRAARQCEGHSYRSDQPGREQAWRRRRRKGGGGHCGASHVQLVRETRKRPSRSTGREQA